jgi:hypothetical protein
MKAEILEKSTIKAGTDPAEATELRQAELESRENKAAQEGEGPTAVELLQIGEAW